jgi:hypothetical protein
MPHDKIAPHKDVAKLKESLAPLGVDFHMLNKCVRHDFSVIIDATHLENIIMLVF